MFFMIKIKALIEEVVNFKILTCITFGDTRHERHEQQISLSNDIVRVAKLSLS